MIITNNNKPASMHDRFFRLDIQGTFGGLKEYVKENYMRYNECMLEE